MSGGGSSGAGAGGEAEVSSTVLSAPPGWTKKVTTPLKGTPKRKEIIFVAPTGEELNSKRQLEKYLKSHPGGPELSEFYWGSGETPRRSSRLGVKTKEVDTPESEPPKKRSRKSLEKKGDDIETEAALEVKPGDDVQMHDAEAAVTEAAAAEVKAVESEETPELNNIDDLRAPVAPSVEADVVKVETKKDDTVAEEEIPISEPMPLSEDMEVAVKDDTKTPEDPQVKVDINVQVDATNEQQQVKVDCPEEVVVGEKDVVGEQQDKVDCPEEEVGGEKDVAGEQQVKVDCPEEVVVGEKDVAGEQQVNVDCPEEVVGEKDVAGETEHVGWTREIQVEDGNLPPPTPFVEKKVGPISEVTAADAPKVNAEDGVVKPQPPQQQKFDIDLEQLPAP